MRDLITAERLRASLTWEPLVNAMIAGHQQARPDAQRVWMQDGPNGYLAWHGWATPSGDAAIDTNPATRPVIVTKMVTFIPGNPHGPAVQAMVVVFDAVTGAPIGLIDGTELTYWKTAAVSGMAAHYLAPANASTLLMVGAGDLAPYLIDVHRAVRPSIERVLVWNRTAAKAEALATRCRGQAISDLAAGCHAADVISCATSSDEPLVRGSWLSSGTHLDLVGGFTPSMRETDDDVVRRSTLFVDHDGTTPIAGDLEQPIASGVCAATDVVADLFAMARGEHCGRSSADEITFFKSAGGAHLDLFAARHALAVATSQSSARVGSPRTRTA